MSLPGVPFGQNDLAALFANTQLHGHPDSQTIPAAQTTLSVQISSTAPQSPAAQTTPAAQTSSIAQQSPAATAWLFSDLSTYKLFIPPKDQRKSIRNYLFGDLETPALDQLYNTLWLAGTHNDGPYNNINPLHRQIIKGRPIVITENPNMHLVRGADRIFIKPIPEYLLQWGFWSALDCGDLTRDPVTGQNIGADAILKQALGLLRTYFSLIKTHSDFLIATQASTCLVPANVDWKAFASFLELFADMDDQDVSLRYSYGELRLTRLKWLTRLRMIARSYQDVDPYENGSSTYLTQRFAPLLFLIAALSLVLSAMQVALATQTLVEFSSWVQLISVARWLSIAVMLGAAGIVAFYVVVMNLVIYGNQLLYALTHLGRAK